MLISFLTFTVNKLLSWIITMDKFRSFKEKMKKASEITQEVLTTHVPKQIRDKKIQDDQVASFREKMNQLSENFKEELLSNSGLQQTRNDVSNDQIISFREKMKKSSDIPIAAMKAGVLIEEFENDVNIEQGTSLRQKLRQSSENTRQALKTPVLQSRAFKNAHTSARLKKALSVTGHRHLAKTTLLTRDVHKVHSALLAGQYLKQWEKAQKNSFSLDAAKERFRFLTLLDCIEVPDPNIALKTITEFKESLQSISASSTGIWLLGCIEVEVVSLELMRHCRKLATTPNRTASIEMRKLDVCETLLKQLPLIQRNLPCYLLIHFHGVVIAKSASRFEQFRTNLKNDKRWSQAPRQIELKKMSDIYRGSHKSMEQNLTDTADYITKGGNDWKKKRPYFKYKLNFDKNARYDELLPDLKNWRKQGVLRDMHKEEPVEEPLSLTLDEISILAQIIDGMMSLDKNRTGYLVSKT